MAADDGALLTRVYDDDDTVTSGLRWLDYKTIDRYKTMSTVSRYKACKTVRMNTELQEEPCPITGVYGSTT